MASTGPITLEEIRAAIRQVLLAGQVYRARDGTTYTMADLTTLRAMEREAASAAAAEAAGVSSDGYGMIGVRFSDGGRCG